MLDLLTPGILFFSTLFCSIFAEGFFCRFQKDFGMSGLIDKRIILVQELDQNVKSIFPQTTFQNCVDGASIPMTAKRCTQVQQTFKVLWLYCMSWIILIRPRSRLLLQGIGISTTLTVVK